MALLTGANLGLQLGVSESNGDLTAIAADVCVQIIAYLGWDPETTSYTDYLDGTGGDWIKLDCPPVPITISSVYLDLDRAFGSDTLLAVGTDYIQKKNGSVGLGSLQRIGTCWPYGLRGAVNRLSPTIQAMPNVIKVSYTVDAAAALSAAQMAARLEGQAVYNANSGGGGVGLVTNDSMDGATIGLTMRQRAGERPNSADGFTSPLVAPRLNPWAKVRRPR